MEKNVVIEQSRECLEQDRGLELKDDSNHGNASKQAEVLVSEREELITKSRFSG